MARLAGKVAIVTGGARGQGVAIANAFLAEGARVEIADVDVQRGDALTTELAAVYGSDRVHFSRHDVSDEASWAALVPAVNKRFGDVNVLVNNAGILRFGALDTMTLAEAQEVWAVNVHGCFLGMQAVAPTMKRNGRGSIINASSIEGLAGTSYVVAYCGSKWAIRGMSKAAAHELGCRGIRVNSVHPGMIDTPMTRAHAGSKAMARGGTKVALGRVGLPFDVAPTYVYLASDESSYVTGAEIAVDGGATATHAFGA